MLADPGTLDGLPGDDESVAAARCRIGGRAAVLVWCRFEVAAGTLSVAGGERFAAALDAAAADRVPVVAVANSGGARMQEGTRAFMQMIAATAAVRRLRAVGCPFVVYLAHPTTGGVFASWASLGHLTLAEPGATIGFTGPRVAAALGEPIEPASAQTAEGLLAHGMVDELVAPDDLRSRVTEILAVLAPAAAPASPAPADVPAEVADGPRGWAAVRASRGEDGGGVLEELLARAEATVELRGDRQGSVATAVFAGLARIDGRPLVIIGHRHDARPGAVDLRVARRAMGVGESLRVPVLTVIDTPGARISGEDERQGFAGEVARSIDALSSLTVPTLAVVAGQGTGGAAMAWLAADRVVAAADAWVAPIAPEAASLIVHRTAEHAAELADEQRISAVELREQGIVSAVFERDDLVDAALAVLQAGQV